MRISKLESHHRGFYVGIIFFCTMLVFTLQAQIPVSSKYPSNYFMYPLAVNPPSFSGNFGEIRGNHFHAGNDYRTNRKEGYAVFAAADGYVSRIKTSAYGYGNGVYIAHPNGFTTVYGHLNRYAPKIQKANLEAQSKKQSFEIDIALGVQEIPVKKGEIIGYSGNTGGSGGPHLHFEIRDTKTEDPINPQLFGLKVSDNVAPNLSTMYVYDLGENPFTELTKKRAFALKKVGNTYTLAQSQVIAVDEKSGFGLITYDASSGNVGRNGTYQVEMYLDDELKFVSRVDKFSFANSRAVNSFMDYPAYILSKVKIQKSFIEPNNPLNVYPDRSKNGYIQLNDDQVHHIKYVACDVQGNVSTLSFQVRKRDYTAKNTEVAYLSYQESHMIKKDGAEIRIPKDALYDDIPFYLRKNNTADNAYSDIFQIYTHLMPLQKDIEVKIPVKNLPEYLRSKALLVDEKNDAYGGDYQEGFVVVHSKNFGIYKIAVDTVAPKIIPINISNGKNMTKISKLIFKVRDDLSGIATYKARIDGKWVLMQHDGKTATMYHVLDAGIGRGNHEFEFEVGDRKNNIRKFKANFIK